MIDCFGEVLGQEKIASLISTDDQSMFVMDDSTMRWATQLPFSPLVIKRGSFVVIFCHYLRNASQNLFKKTISYSSSLPKVEASGDDGSTSAVNHHNLIVLLSKNGDIFTGL